MDKTYLFTDELALISNRLREVFERNASGVSGYISFKDIQQLQKQIRSWSQEFVKPPLALIGACNLERLEGFYRHQLDFSIFRGFLPADFKIIQEEIAAYAAREALDALIGYRLRNWAAIGLQNPKWEIYQKLVFAYYQRTVYVRKREQISAFEQTLVETVDRTPKEIRARCVGELFFEVDRIRLMPLYALEKYLERIRRCEIEGKSRLTEEEPLFDVPEGLQDSFQLFGFSHRIDSNTLKDRYRQLALDYHPDKGGQLEMMQRLNAAYLQISNYLRQHGN